MTGFRRKFRKISEVRPRARNKGRLRGNRRAAVPRADFLADIAAEDVGAHALAMLLWNRTAEFDGEVRNAAPGIERPLAGAARHNGVRGTSVDAAGAGSATVLGRRIGFHR